jgi:hypothetical protein
MFKLYIQRLILLFWGITGLLLFFSWQAPPAYAASPQLRITKPSVNGVAVGHAGTKIRLRGTGFASGHSYNLYTTASGDPANCTANGDPAGHGLTSFATNPTVQAQDDGTFAVDTTWPDSASQATTPYYVCAIDQNAQNQNQGQDQQNQGQQHALSQNTFTVAQPVTVSLSSANVNPGDQVTINGTNWLPPQQITVNIIDDTNLGGNHLVSRTFTPHQDGTFNVTVTIPQNAKAATYTVQVTAVGEPTMKFSQGSALTIGQPGAATPTAAPSPTVTPTPAVTPTPTASAGQGNTGGTLTPLIYALGGIGIVLVVIGTILFMVFAKQ